MAFVKNKTDEQLDNMYEEIQKDFPNIDRQTINDIVKRLNEIENLYEEYRFPYINSKEKRKNDTALLTRRILSNEKTNEPSTYNSVLSFTLAVVHFMWAYDNERHRLFHHTNFPDWALCAVHDVKYFVNKWKTSNIWYEKGLMKVFIDLNEEIPQTFERFLSIGNEEVMDIIKHQQPPLLIYD